MLSVERSAPGASRPSITDLAKLLGIANPIRVDITREVSMAVLIPTNSPRALISAPRVPRIDGRIDLDEAFVIHHPAV